MHSAHLTSKTAFMLYYSLPIPFTFSCLAPGIADSLDGLLVLPQNFHVERSLFGDRIRIVKGVNEG